LFSNVNLIWSFSTLILGSLSDNDRILILRMEWQSLRMCLHSWHWVLCLVWIVTHHKCCCVNKWFTSSYFSF
jgi:hypothetical protein